MVVHITGIRRRVRIHEVAAEGDVGAGVAVEGILWILLEQEPHGVHGSQADHHALALHLAALLAVVVVGDGLHLLAVLDQHDRQQLLGELAHGEREVVDAGDAAAEAPRVGVEVMTHIDQQSVEGHSPLGASGDAAAPGG